MHALSPTYYIVFTAITAVGVMLQAVVLFAIYIAIRRSSRKLHGTLDEVKSKALPTIESARSLLEDVSPKLKTATGNLAEVSEALREQSSHLNATVDSLLEKANAQIRRVDEMVTATFDALNQASKVIDLAISIPARRVTGILHGVKVGVDVLMRGKRHDHPPQSGAAEEVAMEEPPPSNPPVESLAEKTSTAAEQKQA